MFRPVRRVYDWAASKAFSPYSHFWLGVVFLSELVLFLPLDGLLILFCMHNPRYRFLYAAIGTLASTCVAFIGYEVGYFLWDLLGPYITDHLISKDSFEKIVTHYNAHEYLAVFMGSLLPIPFKLVTLSAGFCQLSLFSFLIFVCIARALRFFFIAEMMYHFGLKLKEWIDRHFNRIVVVLAVKVLLTLLFFWLLT